MSVRFLIAVVLCPLLRGQESGAPVIIDGQEVVRVYSPVGSFSASERAAEIARRIIGLAEKSFRGEIVTRPIPSEHATAVVAGPVLLMAVTEMDAESAGVPQEQLAKQYAASIQEVVATYLARHTWTKLLLSVLKSIVA